MLPASGGNGPGSPPTEQGAQRDREARGVPREPRAGAPACIPTVAGQGEDGCCEKKPGAGERPAEVRPG
jgi:hypothetical protein